MTVDEVITSLSNRHPSAGDYNNLTSIQNDIIDVTQIVILVFGGILIILWLFNLL